MKISVREGRVEVRIGEPSRLANDKEVAILSFSNTDALNKFKNNHRSLSDAKWPSGAQKTYFSSKPLVDQEKTIYAELKKESAEKRFALMKELDAAGVMVNYVNSKTLKPFSSKLTHKAGIGSYTVSYKDLPKIQEIFKTKGIEFIDSYKSFIKGILEDDRSPLEQLRANAMKERGVEFKRLEDGSFKSIVSIDADLAGIEKEHNNVIDLFKKDKKKALEMLPKKEPIEVSYKENEIKFKINLAGISKEKYDANNPVIVEAQKKMLKERAANFRSFYPVSQKDPNDKYAKLVPDTEENKEKVLAFINTDKEIVEKHRVTFEAPKKSAWSR